ncbi:hypothetical protein TNCV_862981 [Trichonephila clavipes]|nr:hypothetical protein TNCV_862981 [Trichonephila clavipes]
MRFNCTPEKANIGFQDLISLPHLDSHSDRRMELYVIIQCDACPHQSTGLSSFWTLGPENLRDPLALSDSWRGSWNRLSPAYLGAAPSTQWINLHC